MKITSKEDAMKKSRLFLMVAMVAFFVTMNAGCGKNPAGPSQSNPTATPTVVLPSPTPTVTSTPTVAVAPITIVYSGSITNNTSPAAVGYMNNGTWTGITVPTGGGSWTVTYIYYLPSCSAGMTMSINGNASTTYAAYCYLNGIVKGYDTGCCSATHVFTWGPGIVP